FNAQVAAGNAVVFARQSTVSAGTATTPIDTVINVPVNVTVSTGLPGGQNPDLRDQPGYRVFAGCWFNSEQTFGMEAGFFWLWNRNVGFTNSVNFVGQTVQLTQTQSITTQNTSGSNATGSTQTSPLFLSADVNASTVGVAANQIWGLEINGRSRVFY